MEEFNKKYILPARIPFITLSKEDDIPKIQAEASTYIPIWVPGELSIITSGRWITVYLENDFCSPELTNASIMLNVCHAMIFLIGLMILTALLIIYYRSKAQH